MIDKNNMSMNEKEINKNKLSISEYFNEPQSIIDGELNITVSSLEKELLSSEEYSELSLKLNDINTQLVSFTNNADKTDYSFAVASGLIAGILDSFYVGEFSLAEAHEWGAEKTEKFVLKVAKDKEYKGEDPKGAITYLAERAPHKDKEINNGFHLAADTNTNDFGGGKQHHLRDFAHHASITGLIFSILTQFTKKSYGTDTSGAFIVVPVRDTTFIGKDTQQKLLFGIVYWFFHLVSDMAGSGNPDSEGTGIPGPILSAAKLLSSTPLFKSKLNDQGMSVDGQITNDEEERYAELGKGLDPDFVSNYQAITDECRLQISKVIDPEDLYEVVREGVEKAIDNSIATEDSFITPRLLVWDLLTIAHTDNSYDESEKNLIKYIVRKLGVYKAVFLEMESTILALNDIEKEIEWIKTTDRPYLVIEGMVNELEDRKQVLFTGVKDLISV